MSKVKTMPLDVYLADALQHIRHARQSIGAAQRELPGQSYEPAQQEIELIYNVLDAIGARVGRFRKEQQKAEATNE